MRRSLFDWFLTLVFLLAYLTSVALYGCTRVWSTGIVMTLVFSAGTLFMLRPLFDRNLEHYKWPPGTIFLGLFFVLAFLRAGYADVPHDARYDVLRVGAALVAFVAWTGLLGAQSRWRWVLGLVLFGMSALCWYALVQHVHGSSMVLNIPRPAQYEMRASGPYMCPNHFANALAIIISVSVALMLTPSMGAWLRLLGVYTAAVSLPTLFLTLSRSGWLGMMAGTGVSGLLVLWRRKRAWFYGALVIGPLFFVVLLAGFWMFSPVARERMSGVRLASTDGAARIRLELWADTWEMVKDAPLWGHGGASFRWNYPRYKTHMEALSAHYSHNEFLQFWAEYGASGLVLMAAFVLTLMARLLWMALKSERDRDAGLCAGALGAICASLVHAVFDFNFHIFANVMLLALVGGAACACVYASRDWKPSRLPHRWLWLPLSGVAALLCLLLGIQAARFSLSYYYTIRAERESLMFRTEEAERHYRQALSMRPDNWLPHVGLGVMRQGRAFWERAADEKLRLAEEALEHYARAQALNPLDYRIHFKQSTVMGIMGRREEAMDILRRVVKDAPNQAFYLNQLGVLLRREGHDDEALPLFEHALLYGGGETAQINIMQIKGKQEPAPGNANLDVQ